jgi:hypothetical protein
MTGTVTTRLICEKYAGSEAQPCVFKRDVPSFLSVHVPTTPPSSLVMMLTASPHPSGGPTMAIGIYFHPESMTSAQYFDVIDRLEKAGAGQPPGRTHHSCFGPPEAVMVYDVWESQEHFDKFGATLMPILQELGIDAGQPDVMPIHNVLQQ